MNKNNSTFLIVIQVLLSFVLGVFGNKVSDLFSVKPIYVIIIVIVLLITTIFFSLKNSFLKIGRIKVQNFITQNKVLVIPLFFALGFSVTILTIELFKIANINIAFGFILYFSEGNGQEIYVQLYEIVSYLILAISVLSTFRKNLDSYLLFLTLIGGACGISTIILYFAPNDNLPFETFLGGLLTCILLISVIEFLNRKNWLSKSNR